jgi:hypothetical protein
MLHFKIFIKRGPEHYPAFAENRFRQTGERAAGCGFGKYVFVRVLNYETALAKRFLRHRVQHRADIAAQPASNTPVFINIRIGEALKIRFHSDSLAWASVQTSSAPTAIIFFLDIQFAHY